MHRCAQMGIQYLLHTKGYLKGQCDDLSTEVANEEKNIRQLKKLIKTQKMKLKKLRAEQEQQDLRAQHYDLISDALRPDLPKDLDFKQVEQQKLENQKKGAYLSKLKETVTETAKELQTLEEGELSETDFDLSMTQSHGAFKSSDLKKSVDSKPDVPAIYQADIPEVNKNKGKGLSVDVDVGAANRFNSPAVNSPY